MRPARVKALAVLALLVALAVLASLWSLPAIGFVAPALLLALPLSLGRFVGERGIERLRSHLERPERTGQPLPPVGFGVRSLPRPAGLAVAFALAQRPPPALASL